MKRNLEVLRFGLVLGLLSGWVGLWCLTVTQAQTSTARINGTIRDVSGGIIPDVDVTLINTQTNVERHATTNASGLYVFLDIIPGEYRLQASKAGFKTTTQSTFTLVVNQTANFDMTLEVGEITQQITVTGVGAQLQSSTAELGTVIASRQVLDLPLNGRNFTQLLSLTPGVSPVNVSQSSGAFGTTATQGSAFQFPSINGQNNKSNVFLLDGINDIGLFTNTYALPPILDTIQEFKVQSHNDQAEFGGTLGGIVNVVSRSGTNQFHGSLWEFLRNDALDARNTFLLEKTPFRQNQFGGTLGGPVIFPKYNGRNKTFFYVGAQGFTYRRPSDSLFRVPTEANLRGDLSDDPRQIYNPFTTRPDPDHPGLFIRDPFPNNQIPENLLDPGLLLYAKTVLPQPTFTGVPGTNAVDHTPFKQNQHEWTVKVDQSLGSKDSFWFRYSRLQQDTDSSGGFPSLGSLIDQTAYNWGVNYLHTFSPTMVLDVGYGHTRLDSPTQTRFRNIPADFAQQVGFNPNFTKNLAGATYVPPLNVPTYFTGGEQGLLFTFSNVQQVKANVSKIVGTHSFKWGGELATNNGFRDVATNNSVTFSSPQTSSPSNPGGTGSELASFLLNIPDSAVYFNTIDSLSWGGVMSFYFQDQWKATQKLTVNLGLRYDRTFKPQFGREEDGNTDIGNYDLQRGVYLVQTQPPLCSQRGKAPCIPDPGLPAHVEYSPGKLFFDDTKNFQPRVGLAYRLRDRTALRASFGIFFDNWAGVTQNTQGITGSWPLSLLQTASNLNNNLNESLLPTVKGTDPFPALGQLPAPTPFGQNNWFVDPHEKQPYSMQWNLGIQHQLTDSTLISANYVGSGSRKLVLGGVYNTALTPGPGDPSARFPYPYITPTYYDRTWGRSNYNAFQFLVDKKFSHGLAYIVSYTWSKAIDIGSSGWYGIEGFSVQDPYTFNNDRSVAGFDVTHLLSISLLYELPVGPGKSLDPSNRVLSHIIGNWQTNVISTFSSGIPFNLSVPGDLANTGNSSYLRPNYVGGDINLPNPTPDKWFNTSAFAVPPPFTFGNAGRFILRSDGTSNFDLSVFRRFRITEGKNLEFRAEMFNAFNSPIYSAPNGDISSNNFGRVTSTANQARQIQMALKFVF